ncbi:hypothetical protein AB1Y20_014923 [Prymnesium parvum]|uniref:Major facilitator superfamily (MFS) profile domain-containing protein n=1 Tax=Prymnesium parvum TaxID=97485 RepID=A0AB34JZ24_PRYPA
MLRAEFDPLGSCIPLRRSNSSEEPKSPSSKSGETRGKAAGVMARLSAAISHRKLLVFFCINVANLGCHAVYSVLAAFFPQEAKAKGISDDGVGVIFASFAGVIFVCSPCAGRLMTKHGKVLVYLWGLLCVSASTICFAGASIVPSGWAFYNFCLIMRLLQGVGSALEETAAYAIIADVEPDRVSLFLGICEISTGVGYMIGPPLGGLLFSIGGFSLPFLVLGLMLLPTAALMYTYLPLDRIGTKDNESTVVKDVPLRALLRNPQIVVIGVTAMLANSDYAFLEPTLGDHSRESGLAETPDYIGVLFSVASISYTVSCPIIGILAQRERFGPRPMIVAGLLLQVLGFLLIGPTPLLRLKSLHTGQLMVSLIFFGVGESMSMTPVMDDMLHSCGDAADAAVNSLSSLMASSFSLGQMLGPLIGSGLTSRVGFPWACTVMAMMLLMHTACVMAVDVWSPRARMKGAGYTELSVMNAIVPSPESSDD